MHLYISTMSINSLENNNVNFKSIKYTVHFKTVLDRAHFTMGRGFGSPGDKHILFISGRKGVTWLQI